MASTQSTDKLSSVQERNIVLSTMSEVESYVDSHSLIVFDVFSTLFLFDLITSRDIYVYDNGFVSSLLHDNKFDHRSFRMEAERNALNGDNSSIAGKAINIDSIYGYYQQITNLSDDVVSQIKAREVRSTLAFIKLRKSGAQLYQYAKDKNKTIVLWADSYLDKSDIVELFSQHGFDATLLECGSKTELSSISVLSDTFNIPLNTLLYISDKRLDNIDCSFHNLLFKSPLQCLKSTSCQMDFLNIPSPQRISSKHFLDKYTFETSVQLGLLINKLYDNPFSNYHDNIFGGKAENFGYQILAPLLFGFTQWLAVLANKKKMTRLLFLSRDGFLLHRLFDCYQKRFYPDAAIDLHYISVSRRIMEIVNCSFDSNNKFRTLNLSYEENRLIDFLYQRFHLESSELDNEDLLGTGFNDFDDVIKLPRDRMKCHKLLTNLDAKITNKANKKKGLYLRYLKQLGIGVNHSEQSLLKKVINIFSSSHRSKGSSGLGLVDVGYFGSIQMVFNRLFHSNDPFHGFYLTTTKEIDYLDDLKGNTFGYLADKYDANNPFGSNMLDYFYLIEGYISAPAYSASGITEGESHQVIIEYLKDTGEEAQWDTLREIHNGIESFASDMMDLEEKLGHKINIPNKTNVYYLQKALFENKEQVNKCTGEFLYEDEIRGKKIHPVIRS